QNKKLSEDILIFNNYRMNEAFNIKDPDSDYDTYDDSTSSITIEESLASEENNDDCEIEWKDLEHEFSETASFVTESTDNEGLDYFLDNRKKAKTLTSFILLHVIDGQVKRCSKFKQKTQQPLA
ncbi:810_t:CDS:2, partial [Racocetra persica]